MFILYLEDYLTWKFFNFCHHFYRNSNRDLKIFTVNIFIQIRALGFEDETNRKEKCFRIYIGRRGNNCEVCTQVMKTNWTVLWQRMYKISTWIVKMARWLNFIFMIECKNSYSSLLLWYCFWIVPTFFKFKLFIK